MGEPLSAICVATPANRSLGANGLRKCQAQVIAISQDVEQTDRLDTLATQLLALCYGNG